MAKSFTPSIQKNLTGKKTGGLSGVPDAKRQKKSMTSVASESRSKMGGTITAQGRSKGGIQ